ncbi:metal-sulfur cluster assembly factor [Rhodococcus sp. O3]|uniref:metal-sulfur cluster assembly factor n=1 Tax=Rhodococcus sp. O3 TaxID=3404919 RepID=UPI003B66D990
MTEQASETGTPAEASAPEAATEAATTTVDAPPMDPQRLDELEEAMRDVVDPELGINVVDLGLVYGITEDDEAVTIDMTLTSAACPLTDVIEDQSRNALVKSGLCEELRINWVWMPPWGPDKITDDGREQLRALGFTV